MQNQTETLETQVRNNLMAYAVACAEAGQTRNNIVINATLTATQLQINKAVPEVKEEQKVKIEDFTAPVLSKAPLTTSDKIDIALAKPRVESEQGV